MTVLEKDTRWAHGGEPLFGCATCHQDFASLKMFDAHRVGPWETERVCMSLGEMQAKGWALNDRGRWHDPQEAERARESFARSKGAS